MTWLHRTIDHLFTEPSQARARDQGRSIDDTARRQRELEIEIEARRGMRGF